MHSKVHVPVSWYVKVSQLTSRFQCFQGVSSVIVRLDEKLEDMRRTQLQVLVQYRLEKVNPWTNRIQTGAKNPR